MWKGESKVKLFLSDLKSEQGEKYKQYGTVLHLRN
jgi:hypothetical protein